MSQTRSVVLFTSSYCMGGIEGHLIDLSRGLSRRGWDVALVCSTLPDIEPLRAQMRDLGAEVHALPQATRRWHLAGRLWRLWRVLRRHPRCVVHLHLQGDAGGILVSVAGRLAGAAGLVRTLHNPPVQPITRRLRLTVRVSDALLDTVICVSPETRRAQLKEFGRDTQKFMVVANGVDIERFSPSVSDEGLRSEFGIPAAARIVGTVARLQEERKGVADFIEMAARVAERTHDAWFLVVGDGPLKPQLEAQAEKLGIGQRVVFAGYRRDVPRLLAAMEVAVFPSSYEAAQYVMLEAMATARPVIVTPAGLAIDLIRDNVTGILVPVHDTAQMADKVCGLLSDPDSAARMGLAAREAVVEGYSTDSMVSAIAGIYESVIDERRPWRPSPATAAELR